MHRSALLSLAVLSIALTACEGTSPANPSTDPDAVSAVSVDSAGISEGSGASTVRRVTLYVGEQADLSTNDSRRGRLATWNSSDAAIAQVTPKGLVTGVEVGEAVVSSSDGTQSIVFVAPRPLITSFSIAPREGADLPTNGVRQFSTTAVWSDRVARPVGVTYQATTGTITSSGLFTADSRTGITKVIANCDCGRADTAIVVVSSAVQLATLRINPKTVTLAPGAIQQFGVTASWNTGATDVPPVAFSATSGSVSATGQFMAPGVSGTYYVVVAHVGGTLRDTAIVTVLVPGGDPATPPPTAPPTTPPPTTPPPTTPPPTTPPPTTPPATPPPVTPPAPPLVPDSFTPNLPTNLGLRFITDTRFNNWREANWNYPDSLIYYWDGRVAQDPSAPYGPNVFETFYPGNNAGNGVGGAKFFGPANHNWRRIYFSMMLWVPSNYVVHSNTEKFFYPPIYTNGVNTHGAPINWIHTDNNHFSFGLIPGPGRIMEHTGGALVTKGKWSIVEMYMQMNNPGQWDGVIKVWVDGQLGSTRTDIMYSPDATQSYFGMIYFDGTRGGGASTTLTPPEGQVRRYNRLAFYAF